MIITRFPRMWHSCAVLWLVFLYAAASSPVLATERTVLVVGDSISAAYRMPLSQGWVALLQQRLQAQDAGVTVVNASISGETTGGALQRLPSLLAEHQPHVVVIELGGNDGLRGYPIARLRENLLQLVQLTEATGAQAILARMEIPPNYGSRYTRAFRDSFDRVAAETGAILAPFLLEGVATNAALMLDDGIHPTAAAQSRLVDNFYPTLQSVLNQHD